MTTTEKLAEVKREFVRDGYEVKAVLGKTDLPEIRRCSQCDVWVGPASVLIKISRPEPEKPPRASEKALKKYLQDMDEWRISSTYLRVCPDRPACRLRTAKKAYRKARREERARRRQERALRV